MGDDEEKGEYDTRINKARPIGNIRENEDSTKIRKSIINKDDE